MLSQWGSGSSSKVLLALQKAGPVEAVQWHRCNLVRNLQKAIKSSDLPPHASISLFTPAVPPLTLATLPGKAGESAGGWSPDLSQRPSCGTPLAPSRLLHRYPGKPPPEVPELCLTTLLPGSNRCDGVKGAFRHELVHPALPVSHFLPT